MYFQIFRIIAECHELYHSYINLFNKTILIYVLLSHQDKIPSFNSVMESH